MSAAPFHLVACFLLGAVFIYRGSRSLDAERKRARWLKFGVFFLITFTLMLLGALVDTGLRMPLRLAMWAIIAGSVVDLVRLVSTRPVARITGMSATFVLLVLSGSVALMSERITGHDFVYLFGTVALFDGFSQACGQIFGRRRLAASTSPGKTIEGAVGGTVFALIPLVLYGPPNGMSVLGGVATSVVLCLAALLGDLAASWVKRRAQVKDYSQLLPGHGGLLDRFDSLFGAATMWMLLPGNGFF